MDLLDRYLASVRKFLPWQRQDDIVAELRANLESQLEDKESELGRPLTKAEMEQWLKELGPPIHVAARYQPQRYLIGPTIFPFYWFVLRMAAMWASIICAIVAAAQLLTAPEPSASILLEGLLGVPGVLLTMAAWVTLIFVVIEHMAGRYPEHFKDTPLAGLGSPLSASLVAGPVNVKGQKRPSYAQAVAEVIFGFIFLVWLLLLPQHPFLWLGPGARFIQTAPFELARIVVPFYWTTVAMSILQWGWRLENLRGGRWQHPQRMQKIVLKLLGVVPVVVLLNARDHVYAFLKNPAADGARYGAMLAAVNRVLYISLILFSAIVAIQIAWEIGKEGLPGYRRRNLAD